MTFWESIIEYFTLIWEFISNQLSILVSAIGVLVTVPYVGGSLYNFVPTVLGSSIAILLGVGVLKLIAGWGNS